MRTELIFILVMLFYVSCSPVKIAVEHQNWKSPEEYEVKGRQGILIKQKLSFGEYKTNSVKRSWTKGRDNFAGWAWGQTGYEDYATIIGMRYAERKQALNFALSDAVGNESSVFCINRAAAKDFVIGANPTSKLNMLLEIQGARNRSENIYITRIYLKDERDPYEMMIDNIAVQMDSKTWTGVVAQSREKFYTIHPVYKTIGKNEKVYTMIAGSIGFEIRNSSGIPVAAISMVDNGKVYFNTSDKNERFLMANIASALLLQEVTDI